MLLRLLGTTFAALLGLAFGSFLNVCLSRWPEGESIAAPRSHCRTCNRTLEWWENIPVLSWLALRGRCRTCGTSIPWRYPLVEATVAALWAVQAWRFIPDFVPLEQTVAVLAWDSVVVAGMFILSWLLLALAILDAENLWLPDFLTLPGIALGFVLGVAKTVLEVLSPPHDTVYGSTLRMITNEAGKVALKSLLSIAAAAAIILLIRWVYWLFRRKEGIGLGDAKLMALLAAWLGLPGAILAFFLGVVLGALFAIPLLLRGRTASAELPLGTFLCIGGIVSALWGQPILTAYLHWAGF